jgi:hypothetical protein
MKGREMQQLIDIIMAIFALGSLATALAFCARVGWALGSKVI